MLDGMYIKGMYIEIHVCMKACTLKYMLPRVSILAEDLGMCVAELQKVPLWLLVSWLDWHKVLHELGMPHPLCANWHQ